MRAARARLPLLLLALTAVACTGSEDLTDPTGPDLAAAAVGSRLLQWVAPVPPFATPASSGSYDFGTVTVGGTSPAVTFTVKNNGDRATSALAVALPAGSPFAITSNGCAGISLGKGKSCRLVVTFTPAAATAYTGVALTVSSRKPDATATVTLRGTGVAPFTVRVGVDPMIFSSARVSCTLRDGNDAPIVGVQPTFTTTAGEFASPSGVTNAEGRAENLLTSGDVTMTVGCRATVNGVTVSDTREVRPIVTIRRTQESCYAGSPPMILGSIVCTYGFLGLVGDANLFGALDAITIEFFGTRPDGSTFFVTTTTNTAGEATFSTGLGEEGGRFEYTIHFPGLADQSSTGSFEVLAGHLVECVSDGDNEGPFCQN
jgi:hypothetical protein